MLRKFLRGCSCVYLALMPLRIEAPLPETGAGGSGEFDPGTETTISIGSGFGSYGVIHRDCEGNPTSVLEVPFRDIGASVVRRSAESDFEYGIRGGVVTLEPGARTRRRSTNAYVNPHVGLEWSNLGVGVGYVAAQDEFQSVDRGPQPIQGSGHLRIGPRFGSHFSVSFFENVPLYSGTGQLDVGVRFALSPRSWWWVGMSEGPYDRGVPAVRVNVRLADSYSVFGAGRVGSSEGVPEHSLALGLRYHWRE